QNIEFHGIPVLYENFFPRLFSFLNGAIASIMMPGGIGTLNELFVTMGFNIRYPQRRHKIYFVDHDFYDEGASILQSMHGKAGKQYDFNLLFDGVRSEEEIINEFRDFELPPQSDRWKYFSPQNILQDVFKASRVLHRTAPGIAILGGAKIPRKYKTLARKCAKQLSVTLNGKYSIITLDNLGVGKAVIQGCHQAKRQTGKNGNALFLLQEGRSLNNQHGLYHRIHFDSNMALKIALTRHSNRAVIVFPGFVNTMDQALELYCLIKTFKIARRPMYFIGTEYFKPFFDWMAKVMVPNGTVSQKELDRIMILDSVDDLMQELLSDEFLFERHINGSGTYSSSIKQTEKQFLTQLYDVKYFNYVWPIAKVAAGFIPAGGRTFTDMAVSTLGVHTHAEINVMINVLRGAIAEKRMDKKVSLTEKLNRLHLLAHAKKLNTLQEAMGLLDTLIRATGNPFKNGRMMVNLQSCGSCIDVLSAIELSKVIYGTQHPNKHFRAKAQQSLLKGDVGYECIKINGRYNLLHQPFIWLSRRRRKEFDELQSVVHAAFMTRLQFYLEHIADGYDTDHAHQLKMIQQSILSVVEIVLCKRDLIEEMAQIIARLKFLFKDENRRLMGANNISVSSSMFKDSWMRSTPKQGRERQALIKKLQSAVFRLGAPSNPAHGLSGYFADEDTYHVYGHTSRHGLFSEWADPNVGKLTRRVVKNENASSTLCRSNSVSSSGLSGVRPFLYQDEKIDLKMLEIHPTNICNFSCRYCTYKKRRALRQLREVLDFESLDLL
ncbi:LOG family protein, partial [Candidatus Omnitrophota bacterium]